jgi:hypothetical protein
VPSTRAWPGFGTPAFRPDLAFVVALADDGRVVAGRDPEASVFLLGYRTAA